MDILGIDIGTVSVKYVRYRKKGGGVVVSRGEYPHKEDWEGLEVEGIKDKDQVREEIFMRTPLRDFISEKANAQLQDREQAFQDELKNFGRSPSGS